MRLHFIVNRRTPPVPSPVLVEVYALLEAAGHRVSQSIPEEILTRPDRVTVAADLYVVKSHTELAFSLAGVLHAAGARLLNPYASWAATQDKIVAAHYLASAGVPTPKSWVTADTALVAPMAARGRLIVKPHRGHRGAGVRIVHGPSELGSGELAAAPHIVQEHIPGPGRDLKLYVVGDDVFAVGKVFSADSFSRPGAPVPVSDDVATLARRCGRVLGLGIYGLDVIESPEGPVVVDVNTFPGYKGVPGAAPLIARYITSYATGATTLAPPRLREPAAPR